MKVLIHLQHLLGSGHAVRAVALAQALQQQGDAVVLATGNRLAKVLSCESIEVVHLPLARAADSSFEHLVDAAERPLDEDWWRVRMQATHELLQRSFDVIVTETFPFGRRAFARELLYLCRVGKASNALLVSSVRDILVRKPTLQQEKWMAAHARDFYDLVLVHSDPAFVKFEDSFPYAREIADLFAYTGYIGGKPSDFKEGDDGRGEIIVSCGGGAVGARLLQVAADVATMAQSTLPEVLRNKTWRLLMGARLPQETVAQLTKKQNARLIAEPARADFSSMLGRASLSISQAGYNSVLDVLCAQVPAVFVPFETASESEQRQRASTLAARGRAELLPSADLTCLSLISACVNALSRPVPKLRVTMDGAQRSAACIAAALATKRRVGAVL
ncbi:glycosyltransferase family protein [Polycladidibacter hongkongensis]|uniref:glycosyltransferase family protein n=1 Tax=Polycladidibacter hongkongensis TaxID=1647556 RepID=UPI00083496C5|nr:glycosyltransferase [Pseudovibrio hongkongensis]